MAVTGFTDSGKLAQFTFDATVNCGTFSGSNACGSVYAGYPFLKGVPDWAISPLSNIQLNASAFALSYSSEAEFDTAFHKFLSPSSLFSDGSSFECDGLNTTSLGFRYQGSFLCSAAVLVANFSGCPLADDVDLSATTVCDSVCETASDSIYSVAQTSQCGGDNNMSDLLDNYVSDMYGICDAAYNNFLYTGTSVSRCSLGINVELNTCGYINNNYTKYCSTDGAQDWCCGVSSNNAKYAYFDSDWNGFIVHWSAKPSTFLWILFGTLAAAIVVFIAVLVVIHCFNVRKRIDAEGEEVNRNDFIKNLLANAQKLDQMEQLFTKDATQPSYENFFKILKISPKNRAELDSYFNLETLGWGNTPKPPPAVDPYAPVTNLRLRPPVLSLSELSQTEYTDKIPSMGASIPWFGAWAFTKTNKHYELGNCLVVQGQQTSEANKKYSKMFIYSSFDSMSGLIQGVCATVLIAFMAILLILHLIGLIKVPNNDPDSSTDTTSIIPGKFGSMLSVVSNFYISMMAAALLVIYTYALFSKKKAQPGLLKYLRQVGKPIIEEVMISYSWENGISEDARGLARVLSESGLKAWIDVLKLETADNTPLTTRTVAKHTRFVIIFLTEKYLDSGACFIEFLEATSAPNVKDRLIVFAPKNHQGNVTAKGAERVRNVESRLRESGILVVDQFADFLKCINEVVIHSSHQSHLFWWQYYTSGAAAVAKTAVTPTSKQAPKLNRFNLYILGGDRVGRRPVKISNLWLHSSLRRTGTKAPSIPWVGFANTVIFATVFADFLISAVPFLLNLYYTAVDALVDSVSFTAKRSSIIQPDSTKAQVLFNLACQLLIIGMMLVMSGLSGNHLFDNRHNMSPSLRPLIASFNFRQRVFKRNAIFADGGKSKLQKMHSQDVERQQAFFNMIGDHTSVSALPRVKVLVYDFGTNNGVANTLNQFLSTLDMIPETKPEFERRGFNFGYSQTGFEIYVPVFVFGGSSPDEVKNQVKQFGDILVRSGLDISDCVLIAADPRDPKKSVDGLFGSHFTFRPKLGSAEWQTMDIGQFLVLVETYYIHNEFASEVIFHIGLRIKDALKRITVESLKEDITQAARYTQGRHGPMRMPNSSFDGISGY
ncbi:hypothetical protein HDU83_009728 [Entophlyctis luteolus]|nr:hypothetical protein HDU83_009728 [Entophlyctis luteolus]